MAESSILGRLPSLRSTSPSSTNITESTASPARPARPDSCAKSIMPCRYYQAPSVNPSLKPIRSAVQQETRVVERAAEFFGHLFALCPAAAIYHPFLPP
ncbi:hypothetical protein LTR28_011270 [Elasticomyces elasticus]|nr:hypothetical protein LTR28_011270 [Elasticomyces elasticus]